MTDVLGARCALMVIGLPVLSHLLIFYYGVCISNILMRVYYCSGGDISGENRYLWQNDYVFAPPIARRYTRANSKYQHESITSNLNFSSVLPYFPLDSIPNGVHAKHPVCNPPVRFLQDGVMRK
jgi:hypothetical protein